MTIFVACHHKAGSTYARKSFSEIARILDYKFSFYGFGEAPLSADAYYPAKQILCFSHARYDHLVKVKSLFDCVACTLIHIIRDPRTLIVSAARYHIDSDEPWLSIPKAAYGGKSYRQLLESLSCYGEQLIFEMSNGSLGTLQEMSKIYFGAIATLTIKLEDISWDSSGLPHQQLSEHLVADSMMQNELKRVFIQNSLFALPSTPKHSRTRVLPASRKDIKGKALKVYSDIYGDLHLRLGYGE